jgi:Flp pilus assembly protein TadG
MSARPVPARKLLGCRSGSAAMAFALIAPVAVAAVVGIMQVGFALHVRNNLAYAVDVAARTVLVGPQLSDEDLAEVVRDAFTARDPELLSVTIGSETVDGIDFREVAVSYPLLPMVTLRVNRIVPVVPIL